MNRCSCPFRMLPALLIILVVMTSGCSTLSDRPAEPLTNTITWSTASESDNFGFDIYRAETREGAYVRITDQSLEGRGTTDVSQKYRFVDDDIEVGQEYFYYVESVSLSGDRSHFTPVMRAPPKNPADH